MPAIRSPKGKSPDDDDNDNDKGKGKGKAPFPRSGRHPVSFPRSV